MYIVFKMFFYVVRHLDSIASYLPTGLHLGVLYVCFIWRGMPYCIPLQIKHTHTHHILCCRITTLTFYIF